jgi:peptidylprolyl isomerase
MRTGRKLTFVAASLATLALLGACSSSSKPGSSSTTPAASPSIAGAGSPGTTLYVTGAVPAVTGATNLKAEPTVAAGSSPPPTVLTGKDLVVGSGTAAGSSATVLVQYVGALYSTGKVFDASWTDNGPTTFPLSGVVPGFRDAIIGMHVGGRREIVIPPALGYGAAGNPPVIPPNSTLVFVIDLLQVQ